MAHGRPRPAVSTLLSRMSRAARSGPPRSAVRDVLAGSRAPHARRERARGYNQSALLAKRLGQVWGVPVAPDALGRATATAPQTDLSAAARRQNVRGAFVARRPELIVGRHVLLVDDILTTGATAGECARCLTRAGAAAVGVLTVARVD